MVKKPIRPDLLKYGESSWRSKSAALSGPQTLRLIHQDPIRLRFLRQRDRGGLSASDDKHCGLDFPNPSRNAAAWARISSVVTPDETLPLEHSLDLELADLDAMAEDMWLPAAVSGAHPDVFRDYREG
jgi:hypothetical protein